MHKFKKYISFLFLALLLFPVADKTIHELSHLQEQHCGVAETHFCKAEHHCAICAYVFASSSTPPQTNEHLLIFLNRPVEILFPLNRSEKSTNAPCTLQLRGPPATV